MDDSTYQQQNNYPSSTGSNNDTQGPGAGTNSQQFSQGQGGGYDNIQQSGGQDGMGGGQGTMGSGVAGGYEGNSQNNQNTGQGQQDWLDKGIESIGQKVGFNVSNQQADSAGDFANKEAKQYFGRNIPGVN